jgi:hypothetical protein
MKTIKYAGEYDISDLKLFTASGEVIRLDGLYQSLDIYENMFSNSLTGSIIFIDNNNLVMNGPITGQEYLTFKITTPGLDDFAIDFARKSMAVYKIDARKAERGNEVVQLHFCSPELLRNERTRISKSYEGTISEIVATILSDEKYINSNKSLFIEETKGIKRYVCANKNPYSFIRDLTTEAISAENGSPNFVFFENTDGIHFRTLDSLYAEDIKGIFIASDKGDINITEGGITNIKEDLRRVLDYDIVSNNDTRQNIRQGMLASKTLSYNIFEKRCEVFKRDYFDDFYNFKRVSDNDESDNPIYNRAPVDEFENDMGNFKDARIFLTSTSKTGEFDAQHYFDTDARLTPNDIHKTISHRFAKNTELDNGVKINMEINGNTTVKVGSLIDFQLPVIGAKHGGHTYDIYHSGKFLMTKAKHTFESNGKRYKMFFSAVKDSFNTELPDGRHEAIEPKELNR